MQDMSLMSAVLKQMFSDSSATSEKLIRRGEEYEWRFLKLRQDIQDFAMQQDSKSVEIALLTLVSKINMAIPPENLREVME